MLLYWVLLVRSTRFPFRIRWHPGTRQTVSVPALSVFGDKKPTCAMVLLQNIPLLSQLPDDAGKRVDVGGRGDRASELSTAGNRVVVWYTRSRHCVWSCPTTHNQWALAHPQHQCTRPDVTVCPSPTAAVSADSHGWCAPPALLSRTRARIPGLVNETARGKPTTDSARSQNTSTP